MIDYIRIDIVGSDKVDKYLSEGWEIIETAKFISSYPEGQDTSLSFHIGLPARVMVDKLMSVIKNYEEHGLKEKLYEGVAESLGEIASEYGTGDGHHTSSKIAKYMENYEKVVNNKSVTVRKKYTQEELKELKESKFFF